MIVEVRPQDRAIAAIKLAIRTLDSRSLLDDETRGGLVQALGAVSDVQVERGGKIEHGMCQTCLRVFHADPLPTRPCKDVSCRRVFRPSQSNQLFCSHECSIRDGARNFLRRQRGIDPERAAVLDRRLAARCG